MNPLSRYLGALVAAAALIFLLAVNTRPSPGPSAGSPPPMTHPESSSRCPATPVRWSLGDVDPRFGVSSDWILGAVAAAAELWEGAVDRRLFLHAPDPVPPDLPAPETASIWPEIRREVMTIRFVFHERQDGARRPPPARREVGGDIQEEVEVEAGAYRTITAHGPDGAVRLRHEIRIHRFSDRYELVRVLAHELGHALGLPHVQGRGFIMSASYGPGEGPPTLHPDSRSRLEACLARPTGDT